MFFLPSLNGNFSGTELSQQVNVRVRVCVRARNLYCIAGLNIFCCRSTKSDLWRKFLLHQSKT